MVPRLTCGQAAAPVVEYFLVRETPSKTKFWECKWDLRRISDSTWNVRPVRFTGTIVITCTIILLELLSLCDFNRNKTT